MKKEVSKERIGTLNIMSDVLDEMFRSSPEELNDVLVDVKDVIIKRFRQNMSDNISNNAIRIYACVLGLVDAVIGENMDRTKGDS